MATTFSKSLVRERRWIERLCPRLVRYTKIWRTNLKHLRPTNKSFLDEPLCVSFQMLPNSFGYVNKIAEYTVCILRGSLSPSLAELKKAQEGQFGPPQCFIKQVVVSYYTDTRSVYTTKDWFFFVSIMLKGSLMPWMNAPRGLQWPGTEALTKRERAIT